MTQQCRHILLVEFSDEDALISAISAIEKNLPDYDYASRPFNDSEGGSKESYKFLAFKGLKAVTQFPKFCDKVFSLQKKLHTVRLSPGYVTQSGVVSAAQQYFAGSMQIDDELFLKLQLVFSEKALAAYALTDARFRDRRSVIYLNDVLQLVKGALK
ncbi:MAG: DUF4416 family protein [Leptospiraceae bacterium]|nr:DUF4416 family protein [Leptospiraceae bacterium]